MNSLSLAVENDGPALRPAGEAFGRRPWRITAGRLGVYAFLISVAAFFLLPLYIMLLTSLKSMDEIRQHSALSLPAVPLFANWAKAWLSACISQTCHGISPGFWNSVRIAVPAIALTLLLGSLNGFALTFWRVRWAKPFFFVLLLGAFIPVQVFIYPLVRMAAQAGLAGSVPGVVLVHVAFQLPVITLLFWNYFTALPLEIFKAARVDGAGFARIYTAIIMPMSVPIVVVALILLSTHIWNDFIIGLVFAGTENRPMTVQLQNMIASDTGTHEYNIEMAAVLLTTMLPLAVYFISGKWFVRGIASGAIKG
jgi:glucose/mannose transport system permease protein